MKWISVLSLAFLIIITGCEKDARNNTPLLGTWVDKNRPNDTLVVYYSNGKTIMFDNSFEYRTAARLWPGDTFFRSEVDLRGNSIGFKPLDSRPSEPFIYYSFEWIEFKKEFKMSFNGLRPYLSSIGTINFVKVK
jgi:hypothetical protein